MSRAESVEYRSFYQAMPLSLVRNLYRKMHSNCTLVGRSLPERSSLQRLSILWRILWEADRKLRKSELTYNPACVR